ncbi:MAG: hypothetical protein ISS47_02895 [Candidatus Omnitrophica bacterium]|nr:hypothetical protein [Candidatus Omnitrophota bacterium]
MIILGLNTTHDAGAALIKDGKIIAAVSEERFSRIKHYASLPIKSVDYCLKAAKVDIDNIDIIAISSTILDPSINMLFGLSRNKLNKFILKDSNKLNLKQKLKMRLLGYMFKEEKLPVYIKPIKVNKPKIALVNHHLSHAASAYYSSGFKEKCLVITMDGVGDYISTTVYLGENGKLKLIYYVNKLGSLGFFYGFITEALGWWVGDGEGKTMGLAAYGNPNSVKDAYLRKFLPKYVDGKLKRFHDFKISSFKLQNTYHWHFEEAREVMKLIDKYSPEDIAAKAQEMLEETAFDFITHWVRKEKVEQLAVAGGIFFNVKLNLRIVESSVVRDFFVFPNAGDGGLPVGAAFYEYFKRKPDAEVNDRIKNLYWGSEFTFEEIRHILQERHIKFKKSQNICAEVAELIRNGKIVAWFQGRMEFGPRALGMRSILMDPRKKENKDILNKKVKFREPFRPFCPSILKEAAKDYFLLDRIEPFMITAYRVRPEKISDIPAVVHVDGTSRPQFVEKDVNPKFWQLIEEFRKLTGMPILLNTSFNIKGEPIVCSPRDALKCFYDTGIDVLVLDDFLILK